MKHLIHQEEAGGCGGSVVLTLVVRESPDTDRSLSRVLKCRIWFSLATTLHSRDFSVVLPLSPPFPDGRPCSFAPLAPPTCPGGCASLPSDQPPVLFVGEPPCGADLPSSSVSEQPHMRVLQARSEVSFSRLSSFRCWLSS